MFAPEAASSGYYNAGDASNAVLLIVCFDVSNNDPDFKIFRYTICHTKFLKQTRIYLLAVLCYHVLVLTPITVCMHRHAKCMHNQPSLIALETLV